MLNRNEKSMPVLPELTVEFTQDDAQRNEIIGLVIEEFTQYTSLLNTVEFCGCRQKTTQINSNDDSSPGKILLNIDNVNYELLFKEGLTNSKFLMDLVKSLLTIQIIKKAISNNISKNIFKDEIVFPTQTILDAYEKIIFCLTDIKNNIRADQACDQDLLVLANSILKTYRKVLEYLHEVLIDQVGNHEQKISVLKYAASLSELLNHLQFLKWIDESGSRAMYASSFEDWTVNIPVVMRDIYERSDKANISAFQLMNDLKNRFEIAKCIFALEKQFKGQLSAKIKILQEKAHEDVCSLLFFPQFSVQDFLKIQEECRSKLQIPDATSFVDKLTNLYYLFSDKSYLHAYELAMQKIIAIKDKFYPDFRVEVMPL